MPSTSVQISLSGAVPPASKRPTTVQRYAPNLIVWPVAQRLEPLQGLRDGPDDQVRRAVLEAARDAARDHDLGLPGREPAALDEREAGPEFHALLADPPDRHVRGAAVTLLEVQDDDELGRRQRLAVRVWRDPGESQDEGHLVARNPGLQLRLRVLPEHEDVVLRSRRREDAREAFAERHDAEEDRDDEADAEHGEARRDFPHEEISDVVLQGDSEHRGSS